MNDPSATVLLCLEWLAESPTNQRTFFAPGPMAELIASVEKHGVLQPILVRPWPENYAFPAGRMRPQYEIV